MRATPLYAEPACAPNEPSSSSPRDNEAARHAMGERRVGGCLDLPMTPERQRRKPTPSTSGSERYTWVMHNHERHRRLLALAGRLHERHATNRPSFNVFSVLRSPSDEVNLHSRFLHALLDHTDPATGMRRNLHKFLKKVARIPDFDLSGARVERETNQIDLLVTNDYEAIVIENKIWAGDQPQQLRRYRDRLREAGYPDCAIHLLYLTPDGHKPSAQSTNGLEPDRVKPISYRDDIRCWLRVCHQRAYDMPALRESIGQYLDLVRKMTGTDYQGMHMNELKNLILEEDNVILAQQLADALAEAKTELVVTLWQDVHEALTTIAGFPSLDEEYADLRFSPAVLKSVTPGRRTESGLYYLIPGTEGAWFGVAAVDEVWYGVSCNADDYPKDHKRLTADLADAGPAHSSAKWAPWWRHPDPTPRIRTTDADSLRILLDPERRRCLVKEVVNGIQALHVKLCSSAF